MTINELREYAADLMISHAHDVEYMTIFEAAPEGWEPSDTEGDAIDRLISSAEVLIRFPDGATYRRIGWDTVLDVLLTERISE